jgi:hypothetical protein
MVCNLRDMRQISYAIKWWDVKGCVLPVKERISLLERISYFIFLISNCNLFKISAEGRNPYTQDVYRGAPKRDEQRINLKNLHK